MLDSNLRETSEKVNLGFVVTVVAATKPNVLSKRYDLVDDGTLVKTAGGQMVEGTSETRAFPDFRAFVAALAALNPTNALVFGVTAHDRARIVPMGAIARTSDPELPVLARTRDHFAFRAGPSVLFLDYDPKKDGTPPLSNDDLLQLLYGIWPELRKHPHILWHSASSFIYGPAGQIVGLRGRRIYVLVADGRDIPRAGAVLFRRLQLAGFGHIEIGRAGQMLERGVIDAAVFQPERLDFAGGSACTPPLYQFRPAPMVYNADAAPVNTRTTLPDLSPAEAAKRREIVAAMKALVQPQADEIRLAWVEARVSDALKKTPSADPEKLRETYKSAAAHADLYGDFELQMADGSTATVAEILADPGRFHGKRCADPLEPSYGNDLRIAILNIRAAGRPYIYSHAHGGIRYSLRRERVAHVIMAGDRGISVDVALKTMRETGEYFERNGEIVTVNADGAITPLNLHRVQLALDRLIRWQRHSKKGQLAPCDCPKNVAEGVLAMKGAWTLPELAAVATAPLYHPRAGRIIETDGFDSETGILLVMPDGPWPGVPKNPIQADVIQALETLWRPFSEFPFASALDRGVFLAAILTAMARPAYATAPGYLITASTPGSGKSLAANCLSIIAGCSIPSVMAGSDDDNEMRKRLASVGRRGANAIVLDNLTGYFASDALCAWLTSAFLSERILGILEDVTVRTGGLLLATGNNVVLKGDLCRRILTCRIEPEMETPWKRAFDVDPAAYCKEKRLEMVAAGLTLLRYYLSRPNPLRDRTASFEEWSDTIRRTVVGVAADGLMDVADPVGSIDAAFEGDPETNKLLELLRTCRDRYGEGKFTVAQLRVAAMAGSNDDDLRAAIEEIALDGRDINPRRLGRWIEKHAGRILDGMSFVRDGKSHGYAIWKIQKGGGWGEWGVFFSPTRNEFSRKSQWGWP